MSYNSIELLLKYILYDILYGSVVEWKMYETLSLRLFQREKLKTTNCCHYVLNLELEDLSQSILLKRLI